ncbi:hypothetical protein [Sphingobacterium hungaricum]
MDELLKIGDEIYHKTTPSVKWVVEHIDGDQVRCSTLIKESLKQVKETFTKTSIAKCSGPSVTYGNINKRDNRY